MYEGIYNENIIIDKSLTLMGKNRFKSIINGSFESDVIQLTNDSIVLSNFTLKTYNRNTNLAGHQAGVIVTSNDNHIINCIIENCNVGINLKENDNTLIENNFLRNNSYGIYGELSINNSISSCIFEFNIAYGMYLYSGCDKNIIFDNTFDMNYVGLRIKGNNNDLYRNIFINNNGGLYVCCSAINNIIFHNSFLGNIDYQADGNYHNNSWYKDEFLGGNYWDDYNGSDFDFDGFGDNPYLITSRNQTGIIEKIEDRYPLMFPKTPIPIE